MANLPKEVDLRVKMPPVVDQGELGSCTANAIVSGLRDYLLKNSKADYLSLSRLFLYWHERQLDGTVNEDSGATLRDGMKVLNKIGVCPEKDYPYDVNKFTQQPSQQAELDAGTYKIQQYQRVLALPVLKAVLAEGIPVVIGIKVYESFESPDVARTGMIPVPNKSRERFLGGHAMCAVGYKDNTNLVVVRNSWGDKWGDKGYCYMPYRLFNYFGGVVMDMWSGQ